jgi:multicomponent Na+:H+ antiporter subunit D
MIDPVFAQLLALPPWLPFFVGAVLALLVGERARAAVLIATPLIGLLTLAACTGWLAAEVNAPDWSVAVAGLQLRLCSVEGVSAVFAGLFCVAALLAAIYSINDRRRLQVAAALLYAGSGIGAVTAGDLFALFVHVEIMAVASTPIVCAAGTRYGFGAARRYLLWHLLSGLALLAGAVLQYSATGSAEIRALTLDEPGALLLLASFGVKAAFPLVHTWLVDSYPRSSPGGTVWLSVFTTKVAVYGLVRMFPGTEALVWIGATMACFPIFYAVIENDLRRVLAYSLINQVGFMVCGVGLGTDLALAGAVAHACNDVVFKGLLFMSMGAVLHRTGRIGGNELGGLWRSMPKTTGFCIVGAASISAFPLFSGFVSKSLVMTAALAEGYDIVWMALLFASAGVFHHAGIKIPFFAFFDHDRGLRPREAPRHMLVAMGLAAFLCIFVGCAPGLLYGLLPFSFEYTAYDTTHVLSQLQILLWSALAFAWMRRVGVYPPEIPSTNLDADWPLRRAGAGLARIFAEDGPIMSWSQQLWARVSAGAKQLRGAIRQSDEAVRRGYMNDILMLLTAFMLGAMLALLYI